MARTRCTLLGLGFLVSQSSALVRFDSKSGGSDLTTSTDSSSGGPLHDYLAMRRDTTVNMPEVYSAAAESIKPDVDLLLQRHRAGIKEQLQKTGSSFQVSTCEMNPMQACPLSAMSRWDTATIVRPRGQTRCIFGDEFQFQVYPGSSNKLQLWFDGGGACWDRITTNFAIACHPEPQFNPLIGLYSGCPQDVDLSDYTHISISDCGGDLHSGNVTRDWLNNDGKTIKQTGYYNTRAVIDWIKANMRVQKLIVGGDSAGAIGTQIWSSVLLNELQPQEAVVLSDSYVGLFPQGFQERIFSKLGVCSLPVLSPLMQKKCADGSLLVRDVWDEAMKEFPNVRFASINSKHDAGQITFYNIASATNQALKVAEYCGEEATACDTSKVPAEVLQPEPPLEPMVYHRQAVSVIEQWASNPNYVSYLASSGMHSISQFASSTCKDWDYSKVGLSGFVGGVKGTQRMSELAFMRSFVESRNATKSVCETLAPEDPDDYCTPIQAKKRLMSAFN